MSDKELNENLQAKESIESSKDKEAQENTQEEIEQKEAVAEDSGSEAKENQEPQDNQQKQESQEGENETKEIATAEDEDTDEKKEVEEDILSTPNTPQEKVEYARKLVESADSEIAECIDRVKKDIEEFQEYEKTSLAPIIQESRKLLDRLGIESEDIEQLPQVNADISAVENSERLYINELPSGKGGAFFWGLIGGLVTLGGWYAFVAQKSNLPLVPKSLDMATIEKASSKLAEILGFGSNPQVGLGVAIASAILIFIIIFSIKVSLQRSKNEEIAKELEEKAKEYKSEKEQCKINLDRIDQHIKDLRDLALKYEVLLDEKNAAIRRAIRIESASTFSDLHESSKKEVEHLMTLIREIERMIEAPIVENGTLSQHSANLLRDTKLLLQKHIDNIYS